MNSVSDKNVNLGQNFQLWPVWYESHSVAVKEFGQPATGYDAKRADISESPSIGRQMCCSFIRIVQRQLQIC